MLTRWLYTLAFYLAIPLLLLRLQRRVRKNPAYRHRIRERFGLYPPGKPLQGSLWFHTVSVGEFLAAKPLIDRILATYPDTPCVITTMTPTGSERVLQAYPQPLATGRVHHVYLPYDLPDALTRFLQRFNPKLLVIMETELWPNMIHYTRQRGVPIIVANARLSEKSANGYRKVLPLFRPMMREVSLIAAQSDADGERFVEMGLPPGNLQVTGTVKFDLDIKPDTVTEARALRAQWGGQRKVFIAASTHEGEDEQVLDAFFYLRSKVPDALLVIVPRHPERFEDVANLVVARGLSLSRISKQEPVQADTDVILGDTMGQLLTLLGASDVAFIGGSLVPVGGHNMLEALAMGVPALTGPHVFNFQVVAQMLSELEVLKTVTTPLGLGQAVEALFQDEETRYALSKRGKYVVEENRGAMDRLFGLICQQIS
ncbi:lipid IV(A) 3-deoxy-D-manno-octulosonic acid transferase [Ketobacter sp.]|uniref:lipid IV(A) 3-deoxy-D-manno-octulosonic acid transferase n=1 Tax=Ketobacter sp. TaxID=2083498 RepID=UPI000F1E06FC|nr:lipid IV(A) 3-deoxy-D-manno-octulosonic acid transferase [Ketobacter sp.]RLU01371.1 MAG: 3-deoxy-D-manno-octulosonic acid transferase [Ketobacter sp.]